MVRQAAIGFAMSRCPSVCLSARIEQLGSQYTDLKKMIFKIFLEKSVEEFKISLKSYNNSGYFTLTRLYICDSISLNYS